MLLPKEKSQKITELESQTILIYGRAKIGKTTLCAQFKDPIFFATESGVNWHEVAKTNINSWETFLLACKELAEGNHSYKTVIIDTADNLETLCADFIVRDANSRIKDDKQHYSHISDIGSMGKGWALEKSELRRALSKLQRLPYGLVMTSHCSLEKVETKTRKYDRWNISVTGKGNRAVFTDMSDLILFIDSKMKGGEEERVIKTKPSMHYEAGDRSGLLPEELPLDYNELAKYFN